MAWLAGLWWGLGASSAGAEALSLADAISRARLAAPEVQLAAHVLVEAEASRIGQGVILPQNPRLFGDYRHLTVEQAGSPADPRQGYQVGLDGLVEVSGAASARRAEAERRVALARAELAVERARAAGRAWSAWVALRVAEVAVASAATDLALQGRVHRASLERQRVGAAAETEVSAVAVEFAAARVQHAEARRQHEAARMALRHTLDLPAEANLELSGTLSEPGAAPSSAMLVGRAWRRRPDLAALRSRGALLRATGKRLTREAWPKVGFNLGLDSAPASPSFGYLGLSLELPLAQRNQGPRAVNEAQRRTETWRLEAEQRRVAREVTLARTSFESRRAQLAVTDEALPNAERTQQLVEMGWRAGRFDVFRLTAATRELVRVRRARLELLLAAWMDFIELQLVSGGL